MFRRNTFRDCDWILVQSLPAARGKTSQEASTRIGTTPYCNYLLSNIWDDTEGAAHCDTSDTRLCSRLPAAGACSSGNQKIPLQVQTLFEQVHLWTQLFFSAYTTRRYTDGVWPYNLLPYGLPYVSLCKSNTFLDSYFLQESLKFDQFCFVHIYSLFSWGYVADRISL